MSSEINLRTLVLSKSYMPHSVFPLSTVMARDAICGYLTGKVDVVYWYDRHILTPSRTDLRWPSIIVTKSDSRKFTNKVKMSNDTLYYRDGGTCAYCNVELTFKKGQKNTFTKDHVVPRSHGGGSGWENVTAACAPCNHMKGNSLPVGQWKPKRKVFEPTFFQMLDIRKKYPIIIDDENWMQFIPGFAEDNVILANQNTKPELRLVG